MNILGFDAEGSGLDKKDILESCNGHLWEDETVDIMLLPSKDTSLPEVTSQVDTSSPVTAQAFPPLPEDTECPPLRQLPRKKTESSQDPLLPPSLLLNL